jgi:ABC-type dipeptide/oligopeptide/nickel transport system ATPase subunit
MRFTDILVKNLLRRKARSLLTLTGVSIAVAATVVLLTIAWGYSDSALSHYAASQVDVVVVRAGVAERITSSLSASLADRLRDLPGVAKVDGSLTDMVSFGNGSLLGIPLHGLNPAGFTMAHYVVVQGRALGPGDRHTIILGAGLARALEKSPGDNVDMEGSKFSIAGIFQTGDALESNTAVATLADLQELMDRPGQVSAPKLSVGERQRVAIARSLANDPLLLLADEPTGNLDSAAGAGVLDLFDNLHRQQGVTLVVITHAREVADRAQRTVWIRDGQLHATPPVEQGPANK